MRTIIIAAGTAAIIAYAVVGAWLMNDWAIVAAAEVPLPDALAAMEAANQPYSPLLGFAFAGVGVALALAWAAMHVFKRTAPPPLASLATWAAIIALGAPAYFFASFGNMMSVGDTFFDWNYNASSRLEMPLYLTSGIASVIAIVALILAVIRMRSQHRVAQAQLPA